MQLDKNKFALAATVTMGITYVICAAFTAIAPNVALKFLGWMVHLVNVEKFAGGVKVTAGGFILGLLPLLFYSYIGTWIFAWVYNRLLKPAPQTL